MEFVEYIKIKRRMTKVNEDLCKHSYCTICCNECPFSENNNGKNINCIDFETKYPEEAEAIVQKWGEEHPEKTILDDLLEKYPNAVICSDKIGKEFDKCCPKDLGYGKAEDYDCKHITYCSECWNRPLSEVMKDE